VRRTQPHLTTNGPRQKPGPARLSQPAEILAEVSEIPPFNAPLPIRSVRMPHPAVQETQGQDVEERPRGCPAR
jgi:hypothetical protein